MGWCWKRFAGSFSGSGLVQDLHLDVVVGLQLLVTRLPDRMIVSPSRTTIAAKDPPP